jgi:hypothetical protein
MIRGYMAPTVGAFPCVAYKVLIVGFDAWAGSVVFSVLLQLASMTDKLTKTLKIRSGILLM